jgi:hypothetical protein
MTEAEWMSCEDPQKMLEFLEGKASERKLRLFSCACCRLIWPLLRDAMSRRAVEVGELFADGVVDAAILSVALEHAGRVSLEISHFVRNRPERNWLAVGPPTICARLPAWPSQDRYVSTTIIDAMLQVRPDQSLILVSTVHCISGPLPFRPIKLDSSWITSTVASLAQAIYDERAFDRLPILGDALEDAGCHNEDILRHCRERGSTHARGCWVIDLLLGKE